MGDFYEDKKDAAEQVMGDDAKTERESRLIPEDAPTDAGLDAAETPDADPDAEGRGPVDQPPEEYDPEGTAP